MNARKTVLPITVLASAAILSLFAWTMTAPGHCQIPCGIYDDALRFRLLEEHFSTIEKSMEQIALLSKDPGGNANQLARWVQNKEVHAQEAVEIVTAYFLQQRIQPVERPDEAGWDAYVKQLALCHKMLVAAMKAKQTTDLQYVRQLRSLREEFERTYSAHAK
jgi:nickel superoxide dismutase